MKTIIIILSLFIIGLISSLFYVINQNEMLNKRISQQSFEFILLRSKMNKLQNELNDKDERIATLIESNNQSDNNTDFLLNDASFGQINLLGQKMVKFDGGTNSAISKAFDIIYDLQNSMCYKCKEKAKRTMLYKY